MAPIDRLDDLLERFTVRARQFHTGPLCGRRRFEALAGRGFLHILRAGELTIFDGPDGARRVVTEPSLLFYPRSHDHVFQTEGIGVDLACATLEFSGGDDNPLVRALPRAVTVPIAEVSGLAGSLGLLFDEIDDFRCGHRHVVDRLFEITLIKLLRWLLDHSKDAGLPPGLLEGMADPQLARALTAMHADPGHPWTLAELSTAAQMSRSAFAARFSQLVGSTPHDYLTSWRILVGQQLLRRGDPVSRVAAELGYTASSFSRLFTQRVGSSPRAWLAAAEP
ncbi:AraC family transcriptional regulator [Micropruina sp.]|uniref:AraC family transcriptional regulator n=1 Tax=Micropruina sp. TaxID=2737536 RepID=UPI00260ADBF3|nr:AraC family transcriptional regulator [Micropruina sp.]